MPGVHGQPSSSREGIHVVIADFGLSRVRSDSAMTHKSAGVSTLGNGAALGTLQWTAPEVLMGGAAGRKKPADVYAWHPHPLQTKQITGCFINCLRRLHRICGVSQALRCQHRHRSAPTSIDPMDRSRATAPVDKTYVLSAGPYLKGPSHR